MSAEKPAETSPTQLKPLRKPGYSNPAFKAMGIPPIRLPSRNWMIFWTVVTVSVSGIVYDKQKQKQARKKWCDLVEPLSHEKFSTSRTSRKVTVFVAPPPNDYLDTSMTIWRRYLKPVLYSGGVDYEVFTEHKQGFIRSEVAERIRELRRELLENEQKLKQLDDEKKLWNKLKSKVSGMVRWTKPKRQEEIDEEMEKLLAKKYKDEFNYKNVLGVFYNNKNKNVEVLSEDALAQDVTLAGGVICLGRGAYKEYIAGLHEGILGPLVPPAPEAKPESDRENKVETTVLKTKESEGEHPVILTEEPQESISNPQEEPLVEAEHKPVEVEEKPVEVEAKQNQADEDENENEDEKKPVPKPYITPDQYPTAVLPHELSSSEIVRDPKTHVPAIFHQPVLVVPIPHLIGFLNIPERIYRFYQRRYQAEEYCRAAASCVLQTVRPFNAKTDLDWGKYEENDWPKGWVKKGLEKQSEWVQEVKGDDRVLNKLNVFDPWKVDERVQEINNSR